MTTLQIIAVIITATALIVSGCYAVRRMQHYRRSRHLAWQRMQLLRKLLDLAYVYGSNPPLFLKRFREEVNINHLNCYDVICDYADQQQIDAMKLRNLSIKDQDILLCILLNKGFTPQELSVIYGTASCNSIYVRCSRIRKQCRDIKVEGRIPVKLPAENTTVITNLEC
ncbi:hypothetical protein [uncultured Alistipes sp.]|jgi:hypothetical protein|uniref:hypothetical protein n=1 Tax=uncultured Alistipes sp. TaxID=538949 RepID=UPI0025DB1BBF|nr:hypothetical protein [uncultured Alistipes sp.]